MLPVLVRNRWCSATAEIGFARVLVRARARGLCWKLDVEFVVPHVEAAGHATLAVELSGSDPAATFSDYADLIIAALPSSDNDIVLIGIRPVD